MDKTIFYWSGRAEVPQELVALLLANGCKTEVFSSLNELVQEFRKNPSLLVIADATANEIEASERIIELYSSKELYSIPIVFLYSKSSKSFDVLRKEFKWFKTIRYPYKKQELLRAINSLAQNCHGEPIVEKRLVRFAELSQSEDFKRQPKFSAQERLAKSQDPAKLTNSYGGQLFAIASDMTHFTDQLLLPLHPKYEHIAEELEALSNRNPWLGTHARRVAFVAGSLANSLGYSHERDSGLRLASLFLNWALIELSEEILKRDLLNDPDPEEIMMMGEGMLQTAQQVRSKFSDERVGQIFDTAGQMILGQPLKHEDKDIHQDAQTIILLELMTRACWKDKTWNPYGAYRTIKTLDQALPSFIKDTDVVGSVKKILIEAVSKHVTVRNAFVGRIEPEAKASNALPSAAQAPGCQKVKRIPIMDLQPGMKLAEALSTVDGRVVLKAYLELDQRTVERLWRLAAVRALVPEALIFAD